MSWLAAAAWRPGRFALAGVLLVLAGCAAPRLRPDANLLAAQELRERVLLAEASWMLNGRIAISGPQDGGSGSIEWEQDGGGFRVTMNAPVTGKTWTLTGNEQHAELEGLRSGTVNGDSAAALLERELGWQVPVIELSSWVRAVRAGGKSEIVFREDGLPAQFMQSGWKIEYLDYDKARQPPLPKKIFASRDGYKVRLVVQRWNAR